jgi:hypothetical protein
MKKFYTMKIDDDFMFVKTILKGFNSKSVYGVLLDDDSVYCFNSYSCVEFNGHKFRIGDSAENEMFENAFLTVQALDSL